MIAIRSHPSNSFLNPKAEAIPFVEVALIHDTNCSPLQTTLCLTALAVYA